MGGLIDAKLAAPGEGDIRNLAPTLVLDLAAVDVVPGHLLDKCPDIVTDQEEFLLVVLVGWDVRPVPPEAGKNEPALAGVDMGELEHIPQEGTIGRRDRC